MAEVQRDVQTTTATPVEGGYATETVRSHSADPAAKGELIIRFITGLLLTLLGIRVVLSLLGANQDNGFANFIYAVTAPFVYPFFGLFGYAFKVGVARLEIETLVAMAVYALVGYGIGRMLRITRA